MKATVIVDNIGIDDIKGEWGLSIYIEYNDKKILLDAGASGLFVENATKLNIPLDEIDYAVLSHAHYDHANGMRQFFKVNETAKLYVSDACEENCYARKWIFRKYIGIPKGILKKNSDRIEYAMGDYQISEGINLIPHKTEGLEKIGKREMMFVKKSGKWTADDFSHEQSLVFDTPNGLVIFNSCSHGGAANIINEVANTFPNKKVFALIGGFHIYNKTEEEVRDLARKIKETAY